MGKAKIKLEKDLMEKINVLGIDICNMTLDEVLEYSFEYFFSSDMRKGNIIVTPNPEFLVTAHKDSEFSVILNNADLCIPDGIGVIYGARFLNKSLKEKIGGLNFTMAVVERLAKQEGSIFLFGAAEGIAEKAAEEFKKQFPGIKIAGFRSGYYQKEDELAIVEEIANSNADYLIVCLGISKQERFMHSYKDQLNVKAMIGNGGALDTVAGVVKRAPELWQRVGLEWLFRALDDKKRFVRLRAMIPTYLGMLIKQKRSTKRTVERRIATGINDQLFYRGNSLEQHIGA